MDREEAFERQERRASNIIWNGAGDYSLAPSERAYRMDGSADVYMNTILGALHRHLDYDELSKLMDSLRGRGEDGAYLDLLWLGLENCAYLKAGGERPALEFLRREHARERLSSMRASRDRTVFERIEAAHWQLALGESPALTEGDAALLTALEFTPDMTASDMASRMEAILRDYFGALPGGARKPHALPKWLNFGFNDEAGGFFAAIRRNAGKTDDETNRRDTRRASRAGARKKAAEERTRAYVSACFGEPAIGEAALRELERRLCSGAHSECILHLTAGEYGGSEAPDRDSLVERRRALDQREKNAGAFRADIVRNRAAIARLTDRIKNVLLLRMEDSRVRAAAGELSSPRAWRAPALEDGRVFDRLERGALADMSVDLLLDGSASQLYRQEKVAAQGVILASALTNCGIPVRVYSFCTVAGCTVLHLFRDYDEPQKNERIFDYTAAGWNRDGLAIRAAGHLIAGSGYENRLLIILSDASPNDDMRVPSGRGRGKSYRGEAGITDAAAEVDAVRRKGVSVICVFTGESADLPAAKRIYGRDLARIRSVEHFADAVGSLVCKRISEM